MGGSGKTALVKKAYDSRSNKEHFDCHSWVTVSKSFSYAEVLRAAFKQNVSIQALDVDHGFQFIIKVGVYPVPYSTGGI